AEVVRSKADDGAVRPAGHRVVGAGFDVDVGRSGRQGRDAGLAEEIVAPCDRGAVRTAEDGLVVPDGDLDVADSGRQRRYVAVAKSPPGDGRAGRAWRHTVPAPSGDLDVGQARR